MEDIEGCCVLCGRKFSEENIETEEGWKFAQLERVCEDCFNEECLARLQVE